MLEIYNLFSVVNAFGDECTRMLDTQYRMHETIMRFSAKTLYGDKLKAHESVRAHLLTDVPSVIAKMEDADEEDDDDVLASPLVFFDTASCDLFESQDEETSSRSNSGEAELVCAHVEKLLKRGVAQTDIAVISPYNAQVGLIRSLIGERFPNVEIGSVDGFQGREKEAVVMSLVRSNTKGQIGFLADFRRINVAITRARRHCCLFGDSLTIGSGDPFLSALLEYLESDADYRSVFDSSRFSSRRMKSSAPLVAEPTVVLRSKEELSGWVEEFVKSSSRVVEMSSKLYPAERRLLHELCEEVTGTMIYHQSYGDGEKRVLKLV